MAVDQFAFSDLIPHRYFACFSTSPSPPKVLYIEYPTLLFLLHVLSFTSLLYILIVNLCHSLLSDCSILSIHAPPFCDVVVGFSLLIHASRCVSCSLLLFK